MPKRSNEHEIENYFPRKRKSIIAHVNPKLDELKEGEVLQDIAGRKWKLGKAIGLGGFGKIYSASPNQSNKKSEDLSYVAKVENHQSGPLFCEINCYLRIAKPEMIEEWKRGKNLKELGIPAYIASGSHIHNNEKLRFLILPRFQKDLEQILHDKKVFNLKTVLLISYQILNILEYIHSKGYIHSDIKASNILLNKITNTKSIKSPQQSIRKRGRSKKLKDNVVVNEISQRDQVHLLDFGLASKYLSSNGQHKQFCKDERKAHAGTVLFCSRDAHDGVQSRRSDLETLGYNMIYWLTGYLPWLNNINEPEIVKKKKQKCFLNSEIFLNLCFSNYPKFLLEYFQSIYKLKFDENPDYDKYRKLFKNALKFYGYKNDSHFDFDNIGKEKLLIRHKINKNIVEISRIPLQSNITIKPLLRKKINKNKKTTTTNNNNNNNNRMHWSTILIDDPEIFFREKKSSENNQHDNLNIFNLDLKSLNPTEAMTEIYNKCKERHDISPHDRGDNFLYDNHECYTPAMTQICNRINERKQFENEQMIVNFKNTNNKKKKRTIVNRKRKKSVNKLTESPPVTRAAKSLMVVKNENIQSRNNKVKNVRLKRTYSLRG